jgi:hypothetical protein
MIVTLLHPGSPSFLRVVRVYDERKDVTCVWYVRLFGSTRQMREVSSLDSSVSAKFKDESTENPWVRFFLHNLLLT